MKRIIQNLKDVFIQILKPIGLVYLKNGITHIILPDGFGSFEEIFFKHVYFNPKEIFDADVIIDLGAHQGTFTVYSILNMKPYSTIVSIEPNPKAYKILKNNIHLLKHILIKKKLKVYTINKAVYTSKKIVKFKLSRRSETSGISDYGDLDVQTITLKEVFSLFRIEDSKILIKMDIEGAERSLLTHKESLDLLKICKYIAIEPHGLHNQIKKILENLGFKVVIKNIILEPKLFLIWLKYKPRIYTSIIAFHRIIASSIFKQKITIIKAEQ